MKSLQPYTLALCLLVGGLVFMGLGLDAKFRRETLAKSGVSFPGAVVEAKVNQSGGQSDKNNYYLRVNWSEDGVGKLEKFFQVKEEYFKQHAEGATVTDHKVTVRTLPGRPERAVIEGGDTGYFGMEYLGYFLIAVGFYACFRVYRRLRTPSA